MVAVFVAYTLEKMINFPLKQTAEAHVDYLQCAGVFQAVVSIRCLEQKLDCIFSKFLFLFFRHAFILKHVAGS